MSKRIDIHRPGAIIPAHYESWLDYSMSSSVSGFPVPPIGVDCAQPYTRYDEQGRAAEMVTPTCPDTGRCCVRSAERIARAAGLAVFGANGKCGVCGACFVYGSVFKHESGELVHMGHDCADKYSLMYDSSAWELENGRVRRALATAIARAANASERTEFLAARPGLEQALELGNLESEHKGRRILGDMAARFVQFRSMSEKQVEFALKLADEILNPKPAGEAERHCAAPEGKGVEFEGTIVGVKTYEGDYGVSYKMTVKVTTGDGSVWLAFGTCPASIVDSLAVDGVWPTGGASSALGQLRGRTVAVKATLTRGRDAHFALTSRPSARFTDVFDYPRREEPKPARKPRAKKVTAVDATAE